MIFNLVGKGSQNPSDISDLNVTSKDIMKDKVSISKDGTLIVGEAPFEYLGTEDGIDNYRVLEDEMYVLLPNNEKKLLKTGYINVDDEWTQTTLPSSTNWYSVCYGNGKYVAVANSTNIAAYSEDGITWTQTSMPANVNWQSVCYGNGKFVAVAYSSNIAAYSEDGINWTQSISVYGGWYSVCYGNDKFVAVANSKNIAAYKISYSSYGLILL